MRQRFGTRTSVLLCVMPIPINTLRTMYTRLRLLHSQLTTKESSMATLAIVQLAKRLEPLLSRYLIQGVYSLSPM